MHGLYNRSMQCFLRDTYGDEFWAQVVAEAQLGFLNFEAMLQYDDAVTVSLVERASERLHKPVTVLLEDFGIYLISHPTMAPLRRLLRFGGDSFADFLRSLDDLRGRVRLAVPDLEFPTLSVRDLGGDHFELEASLEPKGLTHVAMGLLRAMADDYGALVCLDYVCTYAGPKPGSDICLIEISILSASFAEGRSFELSAVHG